MIKKKDVVATKVAKASETNEEKEVLFEKRKFFVGETVYVLKPMSSCDGLSASEKKAFKSASSVYDEMVNKKELFGNIIDIDESSEGRYLTINVHKEYPFTCSIEPFSEILPEINSLIVVSESDCGILKSKKKSEATEDDKKRFANFILKDSLSRINVKTYSLLEEKSSIIDLEKSVLDYKENIFKQNKKIYSKKMYYNSEIEKIRNFANGKMFSMSDYDVYYDNIFKNKDVGSVSVVNYSGKDVLLVKTKELDYEDNNRHPAGHTPFGVEIENPKFNIGGFYFILHPSFLLQVANYSKFIPAGYHHPCVNDNCSVCMGDAFRDALSKALDGGDYASAIHYTIDFLKNPNSNNPYRDSTNFIFAQNKKNVETDLSILFSKESSYKEHWDKELFKKELLEYSEKNKITLSSSSYADDMASSSNDDDDDDSDSEDYDD